MKVAKFGGTSLSTSEQMKKVADIVETNPDIKVVVASAPGKRFIEDIKITDYLIQLYAKVKNGDDYNFEFQTIIKRFSDIINGLELSSTNLSEKLSQTLNDYIHTIESPIYLLEALKSIGEDFSAQVFAAYLKSKGLNFEYMSPKDAGMLVTNQPGNAIVLNESYDLIGKLNEKDTRYVIPGFFGYSKNGEIVTFSRGGSDISGAIIARGIQADAYENYTDQTHILTAHPEVVDNPQPIDQITYSEIRELSYAGFGIFHEEALQPLLHSDIPIVIKNTNSPKETGTSIVSERQDINTYPIIGVSGRDGYMSITIKEYFLNRKVGYLRHVLEIFEDYGISVEHVPTGIDYISVVVRSDQFKSQARLDQLVEELYENFTIESLTIEKNLTSIAVVGEGMHDIVGPINQATAAFESAGIQPRMIIQGASEISMFFIVEEADENPGIHVLYDKFFS